MTLKTALIATALIVTSAAHAQNGDRITTYLGGPKSGLTQTIGTSYAQVAPARTPASGQAVAPAGGANAIGVDNADSAYAQTPVRAVPQRQAPVRQAPAGGASAIGTDEAK